MCALASELGRAGDGGGGEGRGEGRGGVEPSASARGRSLSLLQQLAQDPLANASSPKAAPAPDDAGCRLCVCE